MVETPCAVCGRPTLSILEKAFESQCPPCLIRRHGVAGVGRGAAYTGPRGVAFPCVPRDQVGLDRAPGPVRTVLAGAGPVRPDGVLHPSTAVRLVKRSGGRLEYAAAWFCEGDVRERGFDAFVLREALVVRWSGGFATWSRSGRTGWKAGAAFWRDPDDGGVRYGRCSALPATLFT